MANLVTFKGETYDITDFIPNHPGGSVIQKAIGNNLEDVWKENGVEWIDSTITGMGRGPGHLRWGHRGWRVTTGQRMCPPRGPLPPGQQRRCR